jgi:aryl-alcohol dehydrogenase-like predicted oxidoreductase
MNTTTTHLRTKQLGNSDLFITSIGFGSWAVGGPWAHGWSKQDDGDSIAAIHRALELGINWIDTAAIYGLGHSEEVVARALADWTGDHPYIFTKCGMVWDKDGKVDYSLKAASIRREVENSLRRLKVETIDLYQIHWPVDELRETLEGWVELAKLQKEGKVRWIGVSNFSAEELRHAQAVAPITSLQPPYSLIKRDIEEEVLPLCETENIGVIAYSPMASGLLTGAMTRVRATNLPADDWRKRNAEFQEPKLTQNLELVERLRNVGARRGLTPGQVAIAWTLRHGAVTGAIVGARNAKQVDEMMGAPDFRLSETEIYEVEHASHAMA